MPRFHYRALRPTGSEIAGELLAADEREAASRLQALGSYPVEITAAAVRHRLGSRLPGGAHRIRSRDLVLFTQQLATLVSAGVALDRSLGLVATGHGRTAARRLAAELLAAVNRGESLSDACASHPALPRHYAMFVAAGEARGDIGASLGRLAQVLERSRAASRALLDALVYPVSVMVVGCVSVSFLLGFVLPRFQVLLTSFQREPPLAMRWLLALSEVFQELALPAAILSLAAIAFIVIRGRDAAFRLACHRRLLALPWLGGLIGKLEAERLLYLLGNLVAAGVQLPRAVAATRAAMTSEAFRAALGVTQHGIERGDSVAAALGASGVLPDVAAELVQIGEETGALAPMLLNAGEVLRREFETTSLELIALVTPVSIVLLGLLIGAVAAAILGTVMEVYDVAV